MKNLIFENSQITLWRKLVSSGNLIYPNENVIRFYSRNRFESFLDYGCGNLRHLFPLIYNDIPHLYGVDYSIDTIENDKKYYNSLSLNTKSTLNLLCNKDKNLDELLANTKVDGALLWGILHIYTFNDAVNILQQIRHHLNDGAHIFFNLRTKDDFLAKGANLNTNEVKVISNHSDYDGLHYSFWDEQDVQNLLSQSNFKLDRLDKEIFTKNNQKEIHNFFVIEAIAK